MKRILPMIVAGFVFVLMISPGRAVADITPVPGGYYVSTDSVAYKYEPNGAIRISEFGVAVDGGGKHVVFAFISAGPFEPAGVPVEHDRTVAVTGAKAYIETHDNPHATLVYKAFESGTMTFSLDSRIGAIAQGDSVVIGDSGFLADMIVTSGRIFTKSMDSLMVELMPDDELVFRVQGPAGAMSQLLTSGKLDVELDVMTQGMTIHSDETAYHEGATMAVDSVSADRATFSFDGLSADSVAVLDLPKDMYERFKDHTVLSVGGNELPRFGDVDEFMLSAQPGYAVAEGSSYVEMILRPGSSSGSIVVESIVPGFDPLLAVAGLSSALVCMAAGVYLFRRQSK